MAAEKVELFKGENGEWWFRFVASNGEEITRSSEGYKNRGDALEAVERR